MLKKQKMGRKNTSLDTKIKIGALCRHVTTRYGYGYQPKKEPTQRIPPILSDGTFTERIRESF